VLNKKILFYLAISWSLLLIFLSLVSLSSIKDPIDVPYKDKAVHFVFYFVFVVLWTIWVYKSDIFKPIWVVLLIGILLGICIEFCQSNFTNERKFELLDIIANSLGALFGFIVAKNIIKTLKSHSK
jgi:VanZ family protein